jgi:DNA-binding response OmpR family regulator
MAKILLVEDDEAFAAIVTDWLGRENHTVEICHDGDSGLEMTKSFRFDLIILDWQLPGLSGVEVCQSYRKNGGALAASTTRPVDLIAVPMITSPNLATCASYQLESGRY